MRKIRNFLYFFICSFHLNCPTTEADLQSAAVGFSYLQICDAAFSLEADFKSASNRSSLFCLRIANPQERLADLRISLTPSGLANQYYGLIPQHLFFYIITPTDIRKNQTANHGMNVFIREFLAIFLRKVFAEIHLAINQRIRNILMHKHIVCCNRLAILCVDRHNILLMPTLSRCGREQSIIVLILHFTSDAQYIPVSRLIVLRIHRL